MKTNIAILLIVAIATYATTLYLSEDSVKPTVNDVPDRSAINEPVQNAEKIPEFTFTDIKGKTRNIRDLEGKIIVLNFWASWCAPCVKEFPNLLTIAENNRDNVVLLALSSDFNENDITKFITKMKNMDGFENLSFDAPNIHLALDKDQAITAKKFSTFKLPETLIIDQNQNLRHKLIGADWNEKDLQSIIESLQ